MKRCRRSLSWAFLSCWLSLLGPALSLQAQVIDPPIDPPPRDLVSIAALDAEGAEPERIPPGMLRPILLNPLVFVVSRVGPIDFDLPVFYRLSGTARNGSDYDSLPSTITIPKGETSVRLTVVPLDDELAEVTETVLVTLQYPICPAIFPPPRECYLLGQPSVAQGTILDNGLRPTVTIMARDAIATEGPSVWATPTATLVIRRQGPLEDELTVGLKISGSATPGKDYSFLPEQVVIPAGLGSVRLVVRPIDDREVERIETVSIELLPADSGLVKPGLGWPAYRLGHPAQGVVVILDNDQSRPPCQLLPEGMFHLCLPGERGLSYRLEVSPDLIEWSDLGPVSAEDGAVHYVDPSVDLGSRRFYRLQPLSLDSAEAQE